MKTPATYKAILAMALAAILISYAPAWAEDISLDEMLNEETTTVYEFPDIPTEASLSMGLRFTGIGGERGVAGFESPENGLAIGTEIRSFPFPHRFYVKFDGTLNDNGHIDHEADLRYAYGDRFLFRSQTQNFYHTLTGVDTSGIAWYGLSNSPTGEFGVDTYMNNLTLRLKVPDQAVHLYFGVFGIVRNGTDQYVSMQGSSYYNNVQRVSEARDVNWSSRRYTYGLNAHLGSAEAEYMHTYKDFTASGDSRMLGDYAASVYRPAGTYAYGVLPDLEGSIDSIKVHSSYTGRLVASGTLTLKNQNNNYSNAESNTIIGLGSLAWTPASNLFVTLKTEHRDVDVDNPSSITVLDYASSTTNVINGIKPSISYVSDSVALSVRYRPADIVVIKARYSAKETVRDNYSLWDVPEHSLKQNASVDGTTRIGRSLTTSAGYTFRWIDHPSYNSDADYSHEGRASATWTPASSVTAAASYTLQRSMRNDLEFPNTTAAKNRDVLNQAVESNVTWTPAKGLTLTAVYSYIGLHVVQDLVYGLTSGPIYMESDADFQNISNVYAVMAMYAPGNAFTFGASTSYTHSTGDLGVNSANLADAPSGPISLYSKTNIGELDVETTADIKLKNRWTAGLKYHYTMLNDIIDSPYDDTADGYIHIMTASLKKEW